MIIVTGANGFIGSAFVWELNRAGYKNIICVDTVSLRERPALLANRQYARFIGKDEIWPYLNDSLASLSVQAVFHIGACSSTTEMNIDFLNENNVEYTRKLWHWCTSNKVKFVYASSAAVYGDGSQGFDDVTPPKAFKPLNPYGESKAAFDRWAIEQTKTPPIWFGLRYFNVFGPNEYHKGFQASVVCKAFDEIGATGKLRLFRSHRPDYHDGEQLRDFVYVKDITRWMLEILTRDAGTLRSGIYNMGFGKSRSWFDLANATFASMGRPTQIEWVDMPESIRDRYQYFTEANMQRWLSLGFSQPHYSLESGIDDYVNHYLKKGKSCL
jgi:ADP-L-glycero-D-manno-heptose 6-epimerase